VFNPMSVLAFTTLRADLRGDGAAMLSLFRNIGSAIGISVTSFSLTRFTQISHADLVAGLTPFNRVLQSGPLGHLLAPGSPLGAGVLEGMVTRQAQMIAYNDDYRMMMVATLAPLVLLPFMHRPRPRH
jgi:DHA2 family multidrug resistance protein